MANTENVTQLAIGGCFFLDLPESRMDCYTSGDMIAHCVECQVVGRFLTGEGMDDYYSTSHLMCLVIGTLTVITGLGGSLMSYLIVTVLRRRNGDKSFDILLSALAYMDLLCGVTMAITALVVMSYLQNWSRGVIIMYAYVVAFLSGLFARSASCLVTVIIAIERYLVIAFPFTTRNWFTPVKTKLFAAFAITLGFMLSCFPRATSITIDVNRFKSIDSIKDVEYLIYYTGWSKFFYGDMKGYLSRIDLWLPLPLLLLFNGMLIYHIQKFSSRRGQLSTSLKKDMRAGEMFLVVVLVLFICNLVPVIIATLSYSTGVVYLEGVLGLFLSATLNSGANLPIYYLKAHGFREEAFMVLQSWFSSSVIKRWRNTEASELSIKSQSAHVDSGLAESAQDKTHYHAQV